jgi:hypothetical protein
MALCRDAERPPGVQTVGTVLDLARGDYQTRRENIFTVGPSCTEKTHLMTALKDRRLCIRQMRMRPASRGETVQRNGSWVARPVVRADGRQIGLISPLIPVLVVAVTGATVPPMATPY